MRGRGRGGEGVIRKGHGAATETLQRLSQALPAAFAAAAHVGEVDLERDHLAPAAGLVDDLAAGPADHRAADAERAGDVDVDEVALVGGGAGRSEEHTSELQSLMRISYAVLCLKKKKLKT